MQLSVIIVSYNAVHFLRHCLASVQEAIQDLDAEVIVVDNRSADGSTAMVRRHFPSYTVVENTENLGYSKANNQGIAIAKGRYILLLNPDTVVEKDCFSKVLQFADQHPEVGAIGVRMVDGKGTFLPESKRGFPGPWVSLCKVLRLHRLFPGSRRFDQYYLGYLSEHDVHEVDVLVGAFMLIPKHVLDLCGAFDEQYFLFWEDTDLSYRIQKAGFKNYYFPHTTIIHYKGESTHKDSPGYVSIFYGAMLFFVRKHFPENTWFIASVWLARVLLMTVVFVKNLLKQLALPLLDACMLFAGMVWIAKFWEVNYKFQRDYFPDYLYSVALPLYVLVWIVSAFFSGGYDRPYNMFRVARGVLVGTLLISALSNFVESYRFSRALIVLGGVYSSLALMLHRWLFDFFVFKTGIDSRNQLERVLIIGAASDAQKVAHLLKQAAVSSIVIGYISPDDQVAEDEQFLGSVSRVDELIDIYKPGELIFCLNTIPVDKVIEIMSRNAGNVAAYKIVPAGSDYAIGSASSKSRGEIYAINLRLGISSTASVRNKRLLDCVASVVVLVLFPLLGWLYRKPENVLRHAWMVLTGQLSWVGYADPIAEGLPVLRKGVLHPAVGIQGHTLDRDTLRRLDFLYARDYRIRKDAYLIAVNVLKLDRMHPDQV